MRILTISVYAVWEGTKFGQIKTLISEESKEIILQFVD